MGKARNLSKLSSVLTTDGAVPATKGGTGTTTGGGSGVTVYATLAALPVSGVTAGSQAYVTATNRLYIWTGTGWYNIALINQAPTITQGAGASYVLAMDGTPTIVTLQGTDPEGLNLTWSYQITSGSLGSTATITQNANVFTITPSTNSANFGTFEVTFKASDGVNISTSVSTFSLQFITARYANLGSSSSVANVGTGVGISSITGFPASKSLFSGAYPMLLDTTMTPTVVTTLSGTITVEFWINLQNTSYWKDLMTITSSGDNSGYKRGIWTGSGDMWYTKNGNDYPGVTVGNMIGVWNHVAVCCNSSACKYYFNGSLVMTNSALPAGTITVGIGNHPGYYQDIYLHGEFKYTANFTAPTRKSA
jgi:hypothetical protein